MKKKYGSLLIGLCVAFSNVSIASASECGGYLESEASGTLNFDDYKQTFEYANTWNIKKKINSESMHQVNGYLIEYVTDYFLAQKKLPTEKEIQSAVAEKFTVLATGHALTIMSSGVVNYFTNHQETPNSILNVFYVATEARRSLFYPLKEELRNEVVKFFSTHFRAPSLLELAKIKNIDPQFLSILIPDAVSFIKKANMLPAETIARMQDVLASAYLRSVAQRDLSENERTQPTTPTYQSLFLALKNSKIPAELKADINSGRFSVSDLMALVEEDFESDSFFKFGLFKDLKAVENLARAKSPTAFKNFIPSEVYNTAKLDSLMNALKTKQGFLCVSVNAGIPLNEAMFATMQKYSKDMDYDIIIYPTAGILDGLDSRLLDNPNIHILTHTIENKFLRLWNIPILPKNQNGLASLNNPGQHKPMQTIIVGHPSLQHFNVATATNDLRPTSIWSTGSLSQDLYPFRHAVQGRTSKLAENQHVNGFLVLEKADGESGFDKEGVSNFWQPRPVYFSDDFNNELGVAGFTDNGQKYFVYESEKYSPYYVKKASSPIDTLVLGDFHERIIDPVYLKAIVEFIKAHPEIQRIVLHDPIDGGSHNRHEAKSVALLRKKFASGELNYHDEIMGLVQAVNALTSIRSDLKIVMMDSNHSYWGRELISGASEFQEIVNGKLLSELRYLSNIDPDIVDPLEYVLSSKRNDHILSLPPHIQQNVLRGTTLISHPMQVIIWPGGRNYVVGPEFRQTHINFHGHQGNNGAKSSPKSHASGSESSITGDSHQSYILAQWMSVGTSTKMKVGYNDGGYSSWSNSFAVIYEDGTKQLFTYSAQAGTFMSRKDKQKMTPEEFFGHYPLEVKTNANDLVQGVIVDQHTHIIKALSKKGRTSPED